MINHKNIDEYITYVRDNPDATCKYIKQLINNICKPVLEDETVFFDVETYEAYVQYTEKHYMTLFPYQKFRDAFVFMYRDDIPVFDTFITEMGRGNGKTTGCMPLMNFLQTPLYGVKNYHIDIIANNEDQAKKDFNIVYEMLEASKGTFKSKFYWTKEVIKNRVTRAELRYNTSKSETKDGKESGALLFDEYHAYQNYDQINVFGPQLGKIKHPRTFIITTQGFVREGPLDDTLNLSKDILETGENDLGYFPMLFELDEREEYKDPSKWIKANPSIEYMPVLKRQIEKDYAEMQRIPAKKSAFLSKRMNLVETGTEAAVAEWQLIADTNKEIPDLRGWSCTVGVDYSRTTDWMAVNLHFRKGDQRYDINKAWMCSASADIPRIKAPWQDWIKEPDMLEYVDAVEIHPSIVANYIHEMGKIYNIAMVAIDSYRYTLLSDALAKIGISRERKNLMLVKQTDIIKIVPVIDRCFLHGYFHWGNNPVLRWAANNTKLISYGRDVGADKGSFVYAKIERHSRKNDPFMALVASMVPENEIKERPTMIRIPVITT